MAAPAHSMCSSSGRGEPAVNLHRRGGAQKSMKTRLFSAPANHSQQSCLQALPTNSGDLMLRPPRVAKLPRLRGLAARAVLFTTVLMAATATISAALMLIGRSDRFDVAALAPFLLALMWLILAAIPLTLGAVRRAMAPLDVLTRHAERVAEHGRAEAIELNSGDEFETLANALNRMTSRLDASMRRIQEIAFVDPVTRLPNLDRFVRELDFFIQQQGEGAAGAVAVFELQRLPRLMQTLDPDAARDLLRVVAEGLRNAARSVDRIARRGEGEGAPMVARLGVVEFAVFAPGADQGDAARMAQHLNAALNQPFEWRGHKLTLGASCGVAFAPRHGRDADAVIRHARMALGAAHAAPSRVKVFTQALDREAVARLALEREMRGAIERNEFHAYFQPKINLANGRVEACEALARWI